MTVRHNIWHNDAYWPFEPDQQLKFQTFNISKMADDCHLEKSKNVVSINIINSLLKTGNKTYKCKKLQFIHTVNGDASKTAKIIKNNVNHTNIDIQATLVWLTLPSY